VDKLVVQAHGDSNYKAIHRGNAEEPEGRLGRDVQLNCHKSSYPRIGDLSLSRGIDQGAGKLDHFLYQELLHSASYGHDAQQL